MLHDAGIVDIYKLVPDQADSRMPVERPQLLTSQYYGERTVGYGRQYAAMGANQSVDKLIEVWQDRRIKAGMIAVIDDEQLRIGFVQHMDDDTGQPVSVLTLEETERAYDIT